MMRKPRVRAAVLALGLALFAAVLGIGAAAGMLVRP